MANIRTRNRSGLFLRGGVRRRETQWLELPTVSFGLASPNAASLLLSLTTAEKALRPFTIVRTRGSFLIHSDQAVAFEYFDMTLGGCVVSDQAEAIGITAVPTPTTDRASDLWFLYEEGRGYFDFATAIGFTHDHGPGQFREFDSKAMRKVEEGNDIVIVAETSGASAGMTGRVSGRMLIKLH